jgi:hypothetical protein
LPIDVTKAGMVIDFKLVQFWNTAAPIDVTVTPPNVLGISKGLGYDFGVKLVIEPAVV